MAFLAMVHRFNPESSQVEFDKHGKDTPEHNLQVAFELAEKELGIPKLLDLKEVMEGRVDERSLVLYTSLFFHAFKAAAVCSFLPFLFFFPPSSFLPYLGCPRIEPSQIGY